MIDFKVDQERCIQCGECVADCLPQIIAMEEDGYPTITDESSCIRCQHCLTVCPTAAVSVLGKKPEDSLDLKGAFPAPETMTALIKGRRSIRRYKQENLDPALLNTLLDTAWHAPTGVNAQTVLFSVTRDIEDTRALAGRIYSGLEKLMASTNPAEDTFARQYMRTVTERHTQTGKDIILRSAPHVLVASVPKDAPCPSADPLIALTSFELLAQSYGVGTLWNGMLYWCLTDFLPELVGEIGIPDTHQIGYAMSFGAPAVHFHRTAQRSPASVNAIKIG